MYKLTQLPTFAAWIAVGTVIVLFAVWAVWAMLHTIHAKDVEAEILPEEKLAEPLPMHPHMEGHGPVE